LSPPLYIAILGVFGIENLVIYYKITTTQSFYTGFKYNWYTTCHHIHFYIGYSDN